MDLYILDMRRKETETKTKYRQNIIQHSKVKREQKEERSLCCKERERATGTSWKRKKKKMNIQIQREMEQQASLEYLDLPHFSSSSAARRERLSRVKQLLPSESTQYAEVVVDMISKTFPRKQVALKNAGVITDRKRRSMEMEVTNIVAKEAKIKGRKKFKTCRRLACNVMRAGN